MANLNKKFSELNEKAKKTLKEQAGSKKAAVQLHSDRREAAGKKPVKLSSLMLNPDREPSALSSFVGPLQTDKDGNKTLPPGVYDDLGITESPKTDPPKTDPPGGRGSFTPPPPDPPPQFTNDGNQFVNDGTTFGLKPGDEIKNVLSDLKIDKNIFKRAFYKTPGGEDVGPLARKLNQYKDFYDPKSKNKVDGKNYLQHLKDSVTQRMVIDPSKYSRQTKDSYSKIKDKLREGKGDQLFDELSLAEKYDVSKKTLFGQLGERLNKTITEKLDDKLSNFKVGNLGRVKDIKFDQTKFDAYSKANPDISSRVVDAAKSLGVKNIAGVSGSSGTMDRIKNISDRVKSKAKTKRSTSSDYQKQFGRTLQYQPLEYI